MEFNAPIFVRSIIKGIYMALVIFFVLFGMVAFNVYPGGYPWDYQSYGLAASGALTIIVNLQVSKHNMLVIMQFDICGLKNFYSV